MSLVRKEIHAAGETERGAGKKMKKKERTKKKRNKKKSSGLKFDTGSSIESKAGPANRPW